MNEQHSPRRTRITALVLASATVISIIFLVFAFVQKSKADKALKIATEFRMEAEHFRVLAEQTRIDLEACRGK